jgi:glutamine amidotransferase
VKTFSVAVIDYGSGNLRSVAKALQRAAADGGLAYEVVVTSDAEAVTRADRIVLPGVGAFADCMKGLSALPGVGEALEDAVLRRGRPFLGICVGMQLLAERGLEHGAHPGLGWIPGDVTAIDSPFRAEQALKVPHMGWNEIRIVRPGHPVMKGLGDGTHFYFVHSYHFRVGSGEDLVANVDYGAPLAAVVARDNLIGTQFHPEKSQAAGLRLLQNFARWSP